MRLPSGPPFPNLTAMPVPRVFGIAFLHSDVSKINRPEFSARGVAATCSAWNRGSAGASPAALTISLLSRVTVIPPVVTRNMLVRFQPEQPVSILA